MIKIPVHNKFIHDWYLFTWGTNNLIMNFCIWFWNLGFVYVEFWRIYLHRYHLKDVIVGKIYFLLVRIKIKHMEIQIIKRESTGTGICSHYRTQSAFMFFLKFLFKLNRIFIKYFCHNCSRNCMIFRATV